MSGPSHIGNDPAKARAPKPLPLAPALERNVEALRRWRVQEERSVTAQEKLADAIARFTGMHALRLPAPGDLGFWLAANLGLLPGLPRWDPSFVILATCASVEAIFLSTVILMNQKLMAKAESRKADLDLQISLFAEHEVTKLIAVVPANSVSRRK
jgi:uncharacterized membrane protein